MRFIPRLSQRVAVATVAVLAVAAPAAAVGIASYISTPMGEQPTVNPQVRLVNPLASVRLRGATTITVQAAYKDFDNRPDLRTPNAGSTLGSQSQVTTEGRVQGHIHAYFQPVTLDGSIPSAAPSSFCVLTTIVNSNGYDGLAEGSCTAPAPGLYRLSVEMQSNAHVSILKNGPQAVPSSDTRVVRVY